MFLLKDMTKKNIMVTVAQYDDTAFRPTCLCWNDLKFFFLFASSICKGFLYVHSVAGACLVFQSFGHVYQVLENS